MVARVLFLGLDGGTMTAFRPLFERGVMPNLAALWRRSATGLLRSSDPMVTPVAWTNFSTGCTPSVHGIHEFSYLDADTREIHANHAGRVRVPTLWHVLHAEEREVALLNLPMTYPPPQVRGLVVAGSDAPTLAGAFARCPEFGAALMAKHPRYTHKIVWKGRPKTLADVQARAAWNRAVFAAQADAALRADACTDWTTMMVHFHNLDSIQHRLWPEMDVDATGVQRAGWNTEVESCLTALDQAIGQLLELADRRDATVIAVSDHGFGPCRAVVDMNAVLRRTGLQTAPNFATRVHRRASRASDRLRRWIARRSSANAGLRTSRSVEAQVGCDWSQSRVFAPLGQLSGCIYLNPQLVRTQSDQERVTQEVIEACRDQVDPETGDLLFRDIFSVADRYGIDPDEQGAPHVVALSADGYQAQAKWPRGDRSWIRPEPNLPATHYREGVLAIDSPGIRRGATLSADLHDLAPTVLAMLGLGIPDWMEGRVLDEAFHQPLDAMSSHLSITKNDPSLDADLVAAGFGAANE